MGSSFLLVRVGLRQVVVGDVAERERQVGDEVHRGDHLQDRQLRNRRERMRPGV